MEISSYKLLAHSFLVKDPMIPDDEIANIQIIDKEKNHYDVENL